MKAKSINFCGEFGVLGVHTFMFHYLIYLLVFQDELELPSESDEMSEDPLEDDSDTDI